MKIFLSYQDQFGKWRQYQTKHNELIAKTAATFKHCDVLMLAQFSMVSAKSAVFRELNVPVLTAPEAAVKKLRGILMQ